MSVKSLNQSLDAFFKNDDQVLILKGDWGIGKTYRWDLYIKERIRKKDIPQIVYTYVSLFGKTSLTDLKSSIFNPENQLLNLNKKSSAKRTCFVALALDSIPLQGMGKIFQALIDFQD